MSPNEDSNSAKQWPQIITILTVTLSSLSAGQLYAWTSIGIPFLLSDNFPVAVSFEDISFLPFVTTISSGLFSPLFAYLMDKIGRKPLVILINIPYLISWLLIAFAQSIIPFYIARFIEGIGDAILFTALPAYLGEIAEPKIRGSWGNIFSLNLYLGQFCINLIGSFVTVKTSALILSAIPMLGFVSMMFVPKSPYYLLVKGQEDEAKRSLQKLRRKENVQNELGQLKADVARQTSESGTWSDLFLIEANRKALLISTGLRSMQFFSGIAVFMFYTQYIFELANGNLSKSTSSIMFTGLFVITSLFASFVLDKLGRRLALIISCFGSAVSLTIECAYFYCREYAQLDVTSFGWIPITGMLLYVAFYFTGLGIAPMLMLGELFSASIKGKALGVNMVVSSIVSVGTAIPFQILVAKYGLFVPFAIFAVCTYLSILFVYYFVPETKGKTLEEIQQILIGNKVQKDNKNNSYK